ncbi:cytochrome-c peroxidase [Blastopirellula marina]|uniref:Methylamine utilization protein MauG n=1 Tax=Blastopirellula marina DSM 3645 TaxID=314230 RepID=A3ZYH2_9BACT|nr:cytochrome c peroxidase [Blastopirellula marina]EAQ78422.1 Di-haem cytochrome c peroxidase family protein [Blastopirellula marina DSM 3645]
MPRFDVMMVKSFGKLFAISAFFWAAASSDAAAGELNPTIHPVGHFLEGLPTSGQSQAVYHHDASHPLNRLHRLLFIDQLVPEEIQSQLPAEMESAGVAQRDFYQGKWYFGKRNGEDHDLKFFGGDVRVSPVRKFSAEERKELRKLLTDLSSPEQRTKQLTSPLQQLLVQWDVMSVWWQLEKLKYDDPELLTEMAIAIRSLALTRDAIEQLSSGFDQLRSQFPDSNNSTTSRPFLPADFDPTTGSTESAWAEIGRKSSALFQADRSLHASRVFLNFGGQSATKRLLSTIQKDDVSFELPSKLQTALVQSLVVVDEELNPVATPVIDEIRIRISVPPFELSGENTSSSRDGSSHWIYYRTRAGSVLNPEQVFRFVPDSAQSLFLEYGSMKHATYGAQCALCHRLTNAGGQTPFGIRSLSKHANAHLATVDERMQLAESEMTKVVERLKSRLNSTTTVKISARRKPRPERSEQEFAELADKLRAVYSQPPESWPAPTVDNGVQWREIGSLPDVQHPEDNPHSDAKEQLGKALFFDPRLSGSGQIACASCHDPDLAWGDGRTTSFGHARKMLARNAPSIRYVAFQETFFWDGRTKKLEDQAIAVFLNPDEMHSTSEHVVEAVAGCDPYREMMCEAFGDEKITLERIAQAIACFERTIIHGRTRFDAFLQGKTNALSDSAIRGMDLFRRDARCMNCHHGPLLSDGKFHEVGLSYYGRKYQDLGRYANTGEAVDVGKFRTPTLRDVTATTPLMHNGLFELPGVLNMYNAGMPTIKRKEEQVDDKLFPTKSPLLKPLGLNRQDLADLAAFLSSLEEAKLRVRPPELPGLHPSP